MASRRTWLDRRHWFWRWPLRTFLHALAGHGWFFGALAVILFGFWTVYGLLGVRASSGFESSASDFIGRWSGWTSLLVLFCLLIYAAARAGLDEGRIGRPGEGAQHELWGQMPAVVQAIPAGVAVKIEATSGTNSLVITTNPSVTGVSETPALGPKAGA